MFCQPYWLGSGEMSQNLRDYDAWHAGYDDPASSLSWRLEVVRGYIRAALEAHPGQIRAVSACAGDGRDLIGVLAERSDSERVDAALLETHPNVAERARQAATEAQLPRVQVRSVNAGLTASYTELVPADLVLLVGIFGNISDHDLDRTIAMSPRLCSPGATLIWSRGRDRDTGGDKNEQVRRCFAEAGFTELGYAALNAGSLPAVGSMRYDGPARALVPGQLMFTFLR